MPDRRPNILFLFTDQQRHDTIAALGNPQLKTPALDRLVNEGTAFTQAFTPSPVCMAARCALVTGQPPHVTGCTANNPMPQDQPSFMQRLQRCRLPDRRHRQDALLARSLLLTGALSSASTRKRAPRRATNSWPTWPSRAMATCRTFTACAPSITTCPSLRNCRRSTTIRTGSPTNRSIFWKIAIRNVPSSSGPALSSPIRPLRTRRRGTSSIAVRRCAALPPRRLREPAHLLESGAESLQVPRRGHR